MGRKRKITDQGIGVVLDDITNSALILNAMTGGQAEVPGEKFSVART